MIKGIGHTAYKVADMKAALHFYCDILGFKHAFSIPKDDGTPMIEYLMVAPGQFIELFYGLKEENELRSYSHLCLEVTDIEALAKEIQEKGAPLDRPVSMGKDYNLQCWTHDPDGNRIEFMQMSPKSPQAKASL